MNLQKNKTISLKANYGVFAQDLFSAQSLNDYVYTFYSLQS